MIFLRKVWRIFIRMPGKEKALAVFLAIIFVVSIARFAVSRVHFAPMQESGTFSEGFVGQLRAINPLYADLNEADRDLSELVFSGLIKYDPAANNFLPDLAASWERSSNGLIYSFTLRQDVVWHDGEPFTADDVLFTFRNVVQDPDFQNVFLKKTFAGVTIEKTGGFGVKFTLPKANSYFISHVTTGILPEHALQEISAARLLGSSFNKTPIGTGPYQLTTLELDDRGDKAVLNAFPQYYGEKPVIKKVVIYTFPNESTLIKERAALHAVAKLNNSSDDIEKVAQDGRFTLYPYTLNQFSALYFNTANDFLKTKEVRQALRLALNRQELLQKGEKRVDTIELKDRSDEAQFKWNPAESVKLLDTAGFKKGTDGKRVNDKGQPVSLTVVALSIIPQETLQNIKKQWEELGINIVLEIKAPEEFYNYVTTRRYDVLFIRQNLGYNRDVYPLFHSSQADTSADGVAGLNFAGLKDFKIDTLTEAIRKEMDPKDKEKLLTQLSQIISEQAPVVFISTPVYSYALDKGMQAFPASNLDFHSDRLTLLPYLSFPTL